MSNLYLLSDKIKDLNNLKNYKVSRILGSLKDIHNELKHLQYMLSMNSCLWSGRCGIRIGGEFFQIPAADLNAAAAGTAIHKFSISLFTPKEQLIYFIHGIEPTLTPGKTTVDADILPPTIDNTPKFVNGTAGITVIMDTDAGVTKTYTPGDEITVACDVTVGGLPLTQVVATWAIT